MRLDFDNYPFESFVVAIILAFILWNIKGPEGKTFWEHNTGCGWGLILLGAFLGILWFSLLSVMGERME